MRTVLLIRRLLMRLFLMSSLVTASIVIGYVLVPIDWSGKTYVGASIDARPPLSQGSDVLFLTESDEWRYDHIANYALDRRTFPSGRSAWVVFGDADSVRNDSVRWVIDRDGNLWRRSAGKRERSVAPGWWTSPETELLISKDALEMQPPWLTGTSRHVLEWQTRSIVRDSWIALPDASSILRLFLCLFVLSAFWFFGWDRGGTTQQRLFSSLLAVAVGVAVHAAMVYLAGLVTNHSIEMALIAEACFVIAAHLKRGINVSAFRWSRRGWRHAGFVVVPVFLYVALAVLRLDFDGDLFTHWLPTARSHHYLGEHSLEFLQNRYGVAHELTYPPAFPVLISTGMWVAGLPSLPHESDPSLDLFVLLYRVSFVGWSMIALAAVCLLFRMRPGDGELWLLPIVVIPILLPSFAGAPTASEIHLVPMAALSIVALRSAVHFDEAIYGGIGFFLAASLLFLKNDALMMLPLLILPWAFHKGTGPRNGRRWWRHWWAAGLAGLLPWAVWRFKLQSLGIESNFMFHELSLPLALQRSSFIEALIKQALQILFQKGWWLVLVVAMPAAFLYSWTRGKRAVLVPAGIVVYTIVTVGIYLLSKQDPLAHMNASWGRLMTVPVLSAVVYCIDILQDSVRNADSESEVKI